MMRFRKVAAMISHGRIFAFLPVALLAGQVWSNAHAADPAEIRIDRNFAAATAPGPKVPAIPASELRISKGSLTVQINDRDFELETLTVTPPGAGPFPLAVVSHGTPTRGGRAAARRLRIRQMLPVAEDFARRGYKAVVFARRGYASSDGPRAESYGRCAEAHRSSYVWAAAEGAKDYAAVIEALASPAGRRGLDRGRSRTLGRWIRGERPCHVRAARPGRHRQFRRRTRGSEERRQLQRVRLCRRLWQIRRGRQGAGALALLGNRPAVLARTRRPGLRGVCEQRRAGTARSCWTPLVQP